MSNNNWSLTELANQNLTQKSNNTSKNSNYSIGSSKLASPTATINECTSGSTVRNPIEKLKK